LLELVEEHSGEELSLEMPLDELRRHAARLGVPVVPSWGPGKIILEIYEKTTEPNLWGPVFVTDYPKEVSPLASEHRRATGFVERF
jgi:lysyl-tRNA synthetase class 2